MVTNRFGVRFFSVILCLLLVLYVSVGDLHADGGVITVPVAIGAVIITMAIGAGVVFATSEDARNFARTAWQQIQDGGDKWLNLRIQMDAAAAAFARDGIQALRDNLTMDNLNAFMGYLIDLGFTSDGSAVSVPDKAIALSSLISEGGTFDPFAMFGEHFCIMNSNGTFRVVGPPYTVGKYRQVNYISLSRWDGEPLVSGNGLVWLQYDMTGSFFDTTKYRLLDSSPLFAWIAGRTDSGFGIRYERIDTGEIGFISSSASGGSPPSGGSGGSVMTIAVALGGTAALINYVWEHDIASRYLEQEDPDAPVYFTQVVTSDEAAGLHTADVVRWGSHPGTSSDSSSDSSGTSSGTVSPGDKPVTGSDLMSLFIPAESFLSDEFNKIILGFPQLGNLDELLGLTELGEKKPVMKVVLNDYFGITANQSGIDVDLWDDKRDLIKAWIRAALIIFNIIFCFNQVYKLIRSSTFSDTGSGDRS